MNRLIQLHVTIALVIAACNGSFAQGPGYALQLDGVNDYVDLPESASLTTNFTNQITIEAWVRLNANSTQNAGNIISSGNQNDYALAITQTGHILVSIYGIDVSGGRGSFTGKNSLSLGAWYHVAVSYNGSTESIYINGVLDSSRSGTGNIPTSPQAEDIAIGTYYGFGTHGYFLNGQMDELRIWNVGRSQSEIQQTMNDTLTGSEPGLVGYWRFNEGSGTTTVDASGNGNTGTLVNNPTWVTSGALPIQLASFNAFVLTQTRVSLQWRTLSELNNFGFEIQRRQSVQPEFQTLPNSFVPGHGTTNVPQYYSFLDATVFAGSWQYRLKQIDLDGTVYYTDPIQVNVVTSVNSNSTPTKFSLDQNYPNPFNPSTVIKYGLPKGVHVTLSLFNTLGQRVHVLVDEFRQAGYQEAKLDAGSLASGIYFYRIEAGDYIKTKKLVLLR